METIKKIFAANVTYSGMTFNTPLLVEYEHTGVYFFIKKPKCIRILSGECSAIELRNKGKKVYVSEGYYFIKRLAIPTNYDIGTKTWWYINNPGDCYTLNKVSKYAKKIHTELSKEEMYIFKPAKD